MNYCIVAFGVILLIAGLTWVFDGRRHYTGPQIKLTGVVHGAVADADADAEPPPPRSSGSKEGARQAEKRPSV